jgi:putative redox protein
MNPGRGAAVGQVTGKLTWLGDRELFLAESGSGHTVVIDSPGPDGRRRGPGSKELTLLSLGGCSGSNMVSLLRKMRQKATRVEIDLRAEVAEEDPAVFTAIMVHYRVYGHGVNPDRVQKIIDYIEEKYCGVHHMLNKTAAIRATFAVIEESE